MNRSGHQSVFKIVEMVRERLRSLGVEEEDLDDVTQQVLLGAWESVVAGRFEAPPQMQVQDALAAWLHGVSWRQLSHFTDRAHRRREVLVPEPRVFADPPAENPLEQLEVRSALRCLKLMDSVDRMLLVDKSAPGKLAQVNQVTYRAMLNHRIAARRAFAALLEYEAEERSTAVDFMRETRGSS